MTSPVLVLVGPPGAGKSTVGRLAADRLGVDFRDTDHDIEQALGKSVPEVFYDEGEDFFREQEAAMVARALDEHAGVLSLGGGAVLSAQTRKALQGEHVVFLAVGLPDALRRIGMSAARPVLALNPRAQLQQLLAARLPLYREVSVREITTDGKSPEQVLDEVLAP